MPLSIMGLESVDVWWVIAQIDRLLLFCHAHILVGAYRTNIIAHPCDVLRQWTVASRIDGDEANQAWQFHNKRRGHLVIEFLAFFDRLSQVLVEGSAGSKANLIERFDVQSVLPRAFGHPFKRLIPAG